MSWTKNFERLMGELGLDPYGCQSAGCSHRAGGTLRMIFHGRFGRHSN